VGDISVAGQCTGGHNGSPARFRTRAAHFAERDHHGEQPVKNGRRRARKVFDVTSLAVDLPIRAVSGNFAAGDGLQLVAGQNFISTRAKPAGAPSRCGSATCHLDLVRERASRRRREVANLPINGQMCS
jgi:hypothetical protein